MSRRVPSVAAATLTTLLLSGTAQAAPFFETTWQSAVGTSTEAVTDGGAWDRHETNTPTMIEVQPITGPDLPSELEGRNMATVYLSGESGWAMVVEDGVGTDTESDFYWRMYLRVNGDLTAYANMHGFQDFEQEGPLSTNAYIGIGYVRNDRTWTPYFASGMEQTDMEASGFMVLDEFTPELMLATDRWYRLEGHVEYESREGDVARTIIDIRIFDPQISDDDPVLTAAEFRASNCFGECYGSTLQSHYDAGERFMLRATSSTFTVGNNGPFGAVGEAPMYDITGMALAHDDWIGPLGEGPSDDDSTGGGESGGSDESTSTTGSTTASTSGETQAEATSGATEGDAGGETGASDPADADGDAEGCGCRARRGSTPAGRSAPPLDPVPNFDHPLRGGEEMNRLACRARAPSPT